MIVRGAPAIGVAAAMGVALGVRDADADHVSELRRDFEQICDTIAETRPTAVNLFWAIQRMRDKFEAVSELPVAQIKQTLVTEAQRMYLEDIANNEAMGRYGAVLLPSDGTVLTHCNAGALATCGYRDRPQGMMRAAVESGKKIQVYADETRPFLQGARLTAWELVKDNIPTTLISDHGRSHDAPGKNRRCHRRCRPHRCQRRRRQQDRNIHSRGARQRTRHSVLRGCAVGDRRYGNARRQQDSHRAALLAREVTHFAGKQIAPNGVKVENPAFDVTPNKYVTAIITERGVAKAPYTESLKELATAVVASLSIQCYHWRERSQRTNIRRTGKHLKSRVVVCRAG